MSAKIDVLINSTGKKIDSETEQGDKGVKRASCYFQLDHNSYFTRTTKYAVNGAHQSHYTTNKVINTVNTYRFIDDL